MKVTISATWARQPWAMAVWDQAYSYIVRAGGGDAKAKQELENIKLAAAAGNVLGVAVQRNFDAVAQLILKGLPKPSTFVASRRRRSPLLPGGAGQPQTRERAAAAAQAAAKLKQGQDVMRRTVTQQQQQLARQRAGEQARMVAQAKARSAAALRVEARRAEQEGYENELAMRRQQLERRDLDDEVRAKLTAQAEQYEALIDKLATPGAVATAATEPSETSEAMAAEQVEAEQDDAAEAYPSGVPGDVEFADAGT